MKKLAFLIIVFLLGSCVQKEESPEYNPEPLPAPTISVEESIVRWEAIPGVVNYIVELNGSVFIAVAENFLDLEHVGAGDYTVRIYAAGDGRNYSDSPWSTSVLASVTGVLGNTEIKIAQSSFMEAYSNTAVPSIMTWDEVEKADGYIVRVDGTEVATVTELEFELSPYPGVHTVSVQAYNGDRDGVHSLSEEISRIVTIKVFGTGTESDPWMLYDSFDWADFASLVNSKHKFTSEYVSIGADIDFASSAVNTVGSSSSARFEGVLDGCGRELRNASIGGGSATLAGFFVALNGVVRNVVFDGITVSMAGTGVTKGSVISGGDTGPDAKIINCKVLNSSISCRGYGNMIAASIRSGATEIKGCTVENCTITGIDAGAGAVVAYLAAAGSKVVDCVVKNTTITSKGSAGSIVGTGAVGYIVNCIADGNTISTVSNSGTGVLVGTNASTAGGLHIVNNLSKNCTVSNKTNTSEAYLSLLLGKEAVNGGKIQNNVVVSGMIDHACTVKPRIGFFVGTKSSGQWSANYYNDALVTSANQGDGGNLGAIGNTEFAGAKTGGSKAVGAAAGEGIDVVLSDLVTVLNDNIKNNNYVSDFPEIRTWVAGPDGWPIFNYGE